MTKYPNVHNVHMPATSTPQRSTHPVRGAQSIDRAVQVLQQVAARHADGLALRELVQASGLDRTTTYRIASSLVQAGLLSRDEGTTQYRLGLEVMALGLASLQRPPLVAHSLPAMKALARRSGDPVFLVVRSGDYSHCLHLEEGVRPIHTFADTVGNLRLLGLGIPSFTMLARMEDAAVAAHHARHAAEYQAQRMSLTKLQRWVRQTRELGYAQVVAQGLGGVGMHFALGSCGDAALGIVTAAARIPRTRGPELATMMREELDRFGLR